MKGSFPLKNRLSLFLILALVCLAGIYLVWRTRAVRAPVAFVQAHSVPLRPQWQDGAWYWIEAPAKAPHHLVRATASGASPVAQAEQITDYTVAAGKVVWTAREGGQWSISVAAADGSGRRVLWSGDREPKGLLLAEGRVYWLEQMPPAIPDSGPLPPLTSTLRLLSIPLDGGGTPQAITTLMEPEGGQVIGIQGGQLYVSTLRPGSPGSTVIYRIALQGGVAKRILAESGRQRALLTREGDLYWTAPSPESTRMDVVLSVYRLRKEGKPELMADWLPAEGQIYETQRGLYYVDGSYTAAAWPLKDQGRLSRALPSPPEYYAVATGGQEILMRQYGPSAQEIPLYKADLP